MFLRLDSHSSVFKKTKRQLTLAVRQTVWQDIYKHVNRCMIGLLVCFLCACTQRGALPVSALADTEQNRSAIQIPSVPHTDSRSALERYQDLLAHTQDAETRRLVQGRIADLTLLSIEEKSGTQALSTSDIQKLNDALHLYEQLLDQPGNSTETANILYQKARLHELLGQQQPLRDTLDTLVKNHPNSPYFEEAQFRRAELFYASKQFSKAARAYQQVLNKNEDGRFYQQSLYKLAWSEYKTNDYPAALNFFLELINRLEQDSVKQENSPAQLSLLNDSYRACSLSLAQLDGALSIENYFKTHGPQPFEYNVYWSLSQHYLSHERYSDAAATLEHFVVVHPLDPHGPDFQAQAIKALQAGNLAALALVATERYNDYFGLRSVFWLQNNNNTAFKDQLKTELTTLSTVYHSVASNSNKEEDFRKAAHWYRILLETFPNDSDSLVTRQLLAQSLLDAHQDAEAIEQLRLLASQTHLSASEAANSRYAIVMIYEKELAKLPENSNQGQQVLLKQTQAAEQFYINHPNDTRTPALLANTLASLIKLNENQKALVLAEQIIHLPPRPENTTAQLNAWITLGKAHMQSAQFAEAETAFHQAESLTTDTSQRAILEDKRAQALYSHAEQQQKSAQNESQKTQAAQDFARIAQLLPQSKLRPDADFAAAVIYLQNQQWPQAIAALTAFRTRFPNHALNETVPDKLALAYEKNGQWQAAARELDSIQQRYATSDAELARQALWKSAQLFEQAGNTPAAQTAYTRYAERYPQAFETQIEAQYKLSLIAKNNRALDQQILWLSQIKQSYLRANQHATPRMRYLAAYSAYSLGRIYQQKVKEIPQQQALDKSIQAKKPLLETSITHFNEAIQLGEAQFVSAAIFQQAELYRQFAKDLLTSQAPAHLDAEALEQYQLLLEEQALPIEDKAIALYQQNTALTKQGIYNRWVKKSFVRLRDLLPARYRKDEKLESDFDVQL